MFHIGDTGKRWSIRSGGRLVLFQTNTFLISNDPNPANSRTTSRSVSLESTKPTYKSRYGNYNRTGINKKLAKTSIAADLIPDADIAKTDQTAGYGFYEVDNVSYGPFRSYNKGADNTSDSGTISGARPEVLFRLPPMFHKTKRKTAGTAVKKFTTWSLVKMFSVHKRGPVI